MKRKAEIFDQFQYLYEVTGYSDHQIHCVVYFDDKIDPDILKEAFRLLLKAVPILSGIYHHKGGASYWEPVLPERVQEILSVAGNEEEFQKFTTSRTDESTGPQIKACVFQTDKAALSVIINHMICDGAGFKQLLYLLSDLYCALIQGEKGLPGRLINGDRGLQEIISGVSFSDRIKALLLQRKESNQKSCMQFPVSGEKEAAPFIAAYKIPEKRYLAISEYCRQKKVTFNDVILTACDRVLAKYLKAEGKELLIPIMVDMRRYLQDKRFHALTNLSSTVITRITINPEESFDETLLKVSKDMARKKAGKIGLNGFVKLSLLYRLLPGKLCYKLMKNGLQNPYISMTNIGMIDADRFIFRGSRVTDVFMCGSIKYRPYFQMAVTSFRNTMTLSSNLYGSIQDKKRIAEFLSDVGKELPD